MKTTNLPQIVFLMDTLWFILLMNGHASEMYRYDFQENLSVECPHMSDLFYKNCKNVYQLTGHFYKMLNGLLIMQKFFYYSVPTYFHWNSGKLIYGVPLWPIYLYILLAAFMLESSSKRHHYVAI